MTVKMSDKKGVNPAAAGLIGAVVGAAAGAAAVVMSDEKTRRKVEKAIKVLKNEGIKKYQEFQGSVSRVQRKTKAELSEKEESLP